MGTGASLLKAAYSVPQSSHTCTVQDPVANFHLRNGASIAHLHWGADLSARGKAGSFGIMVNYQCAPSSLDCIRAPLLDACCC